MFHFLRREKTYFISYTVQLDLSNYTLNHQTVKIKYRKGADHLSDVIRQLAEKNQCSVKQIVVTAFNEC